MDNKMDGWVNGEKGMLMVFKGKYNLKKLKNKLFVY